MKSNSNCVDGYPQEVRGRDFIPVQLDGYTLGRAYVVQRTSSGPTRFDVCVSTSAYPARSLVLANCRRPEYAALIVDALKAKYGKEADDAES